MSILDVSSLECLSCVTSSLASALISGIYTDEQVTGLSLPVLLAHSALIEPAACYMSIAGGGLVYGTILVYSGWFGGGSDDEF